MNDCRKIGPRMSAITEGELLAVRRIPGQERIALTIAVPIDVQIELDAPLLVAYIAGSETD